MTERREAGQEVAACRTMQELHNRYQLATQTYSRAVDALNARIGAVKGDEYYFLRQIVDDARARSEEARNEFDRHIAEHGC